MDNVEAKMEKKLGKGFFGKKKPRTIAEATASLQENIDNLKSVHALRDEAAAAKTIKIAELQKQQVEDEKEAKGAKRLADKLESFFYGDLDLED